MDSEKIELFRKNLRTVRILIDFHQKELASNDGVPIDQFHILFALDGLKECSMVKLAEVLSMDKSKVSRAISKLVKAGFVNREINPENRRYSILTLTSHGQKIVQDINEQNNLLFENILSRLPQDNKELFIENFAVFTTAFKEMLKSQKNDK
jgi:DNA-binding MarR family transcriptional regulator